MTEAQEIVAKAIKNSIGTRGTPSAYKLARDLEVTDATISKWRNGTTHPSGHHLLKLIKIAHRQSGKALMQFIVTMGACALVLMIGYAAITWTLKGMTDTALRSVNKNITAMKKSMEKGPPKPQQSQDCILCKVIDWVFGLLSSNQNVSVYAG